MMFHVFLLLYGSFKAGRNVRARERPVFSVVGEDKLRHCRTPAGAQNSGEGCVPAYLVREPGQAREVDPSRRRRIHRAGQELLHIYAIPSMFVGHSGTALAAALL